MHRFKSIKMKVGQKSSDGKVPKPPKPPEKPLMPYMRYSRKVWESVKNSNPHLKLWEVGKIIGQMWRELPENEKTHFVEEYDNDKVQYNDALRLYHNSPAYKSWLAHKERVEKTLEEAENLEKQKERFQKESHLVETRESYILEDNDEDPDEVFTVKHVAAQRYQRNQKLMLELFSDFKLPELGSVVTQNRLNTLVQQVDGLISHKRKLDDEVDLFQSSHENKKQKIKTESEKFWNDYKKELDARPVITEKMFTEMVKKAREDIIREEKERELYKTKLAANANNASQDGKSTSITETSVVSNNPQTNPANSAVNQAKQLTLTDSKTNQSNNELPTSASTTSHITSTVPSTNSQYNAQQYRLNSQYPPHQQQQFSTQNPNNQSQQSSELDATVQKIGNVQRNLIEFNPSSSNANASTNSAVAHSETASTQLSSNSTNEHDFISKQQQQSPCPSNLSSSTNSRAPILSPAAPEYLDTISSNNSVDTPTSNPNNGNPSTASTGSKTTQYLQQHQPTSNAMMSCSQETNISNISSASNNQPPTIVSMQSPPPMIINSGANSTTGTPNVTGKKPPSSTGSVGSTGSKKSRSNATSKERKNSANSTANSNAVSTTGTTSVSNMPPATSRNIATPTTTNSNSVELESISSSGGQRTPDNTIPTTVSTGIMHPNSPAMSAASAYMQQQQQQHQQNMQHHHQFQQHHNQYPGAPPPPYPPYYHHHPSQFMQASPRPPYPNAPAGVSSPYAQHPHLSGYYQQYRMDPSKIPPPPYATPPGFHHNIPPGYPGSAAAQYMTPPQFMQQQQVIPTSSPSISQSQPPVIPTSQPQQQIDTTQQQSSDSNGNGSTNSTMPISSISNSQHGPVSSAGSIEEAAKLSAAITAASSMSIASTAGINTTSLSATSSQDMPLAVTSSNAQSAMAPTTASGLTPPQTAMPPGMIPTSMSGHAIPGPHPMYHHPSHQYQQQPGMPPMIPSSVAGMPPSPLVGAPPGTTNPVNAAAHYPPTHYMYYQHHAQHPGNPGAAVPPGTMAPIPTNPMASPEYHSGVPGAGNPYWGHHHHHPGQSSAVATPPGAPGTMSYSHIPGMTTAPGMMMSQQQSSVSSPAITQPSNTASSTADMSAVPTASSVNSQTQQSQAIATSNTSISNANVPALITNTGQDSSQPTK